MVFLIKDSSCNIVDSCVRGCMLSTYFSGFLSWSFKFASKVFECLTHTKVRQYYISLKRPNFIKVIRTSITVGVHLVNICHIKHFINQASSFPMVSCHKTPHPQSISLSHALNCHMSHMRLHHEAIFNLSQNFKLSLFSTNAW